MSTCIADSKRQFEWQRERGCGSEGVVLWNCKALHSRCDRYQSLAAFMPLDECNPALKAVSLCMDRNRKPFVEPQPAQP
jgi:hypothetical protein